MNGKGGQCASDVFDGCAVVHRNMKPTRDRDHYGGALTDAQPGIGYAA